MTRKPIKRFLPLTYPPKISGVLDGTIKQSIRIDTDLKVGDFVAFHGWSGKPYHSPWSFRTPYMRITVASTIRIKTDKVIFKDLQLPQRVKRIGDPYLDELAARDGIHPATGEELIRVLHAMHGDGTLDGKILRWDPTPIKKHSRAAQIIPSENRVLNAVTKDFVQIGDIQKTCRDNPAVLQ